MSMPILNRRLQVLIDDERFELVEQKARAGGISVGEFVRRALDTAVNADEMVSRQRLTLDRLLAAPRMDVGSPGELRDLIDEAHVSTNLAD